MNRTCSSLLLPLLSTIALSAIISTAACSSDSNTVTNTDAGGGGSDAGDGGSTTDSGSDAGTTAPTLSFKASNIKLDGIDASKLGDFVVASANCEIRTEEKIVGCGDMDKLQFAIIDQPGGGKIGMYVAKSFRVEPNAGLRTKGTYALAIVAIDSFDIQGTIDVGAQNSYPTAGGYVHGATAGAKGGGPGGGGAGSSTNAGGGGGFCGTGGKGAAIAAGTAGAGGVTYGNPTLIPLIGGSAGGSAALTDSGSGGGAVQLVAGKTFTLGANAFINAGGGGGTFVGAASSQHGAGGGSGGAILIEAPTVSLLGTLAANGGAGGSKDVGQDGKLDGTQAVGTAQTNGSLGGSGSAQEGPNGVDGTWVDGDNAAGGGGGAGRIRVNSTTGNSALSAKVLSPSANGPCTTEGTLTAN